MAEQSVQERYAPGSTCFGCGPANPDGLHIRSFPAGDELVAEWQSRPRYEAFPGALSGGIAGTMLDCHSNWAATLELMRRSGAATPPATVTSRFEVRFLRPASTNGPIVLHARVVDVLPERATVESTLEAGGVTCATFRGTFVAVPEGHPAFGRW
jgi:acyl-coenzyme A thioesterase PaaI-like protein